jgi:hypothetical protein
MKLTKPFSPSIALFSVAASLGVATVISSAAPASAISGPVGLGFVCTSTSNAAPFGCPVGTAQFSAVVSPVGTNQALFSFTNLGPLASSITNIDIFDTFPVLGGLANPQPSNTGVNFFTGNAGVDPLTGATQFFSFSLGNASQAVSNGINPLDNFSVLFDINTAPGFSKPFNAVSTSLFKKGVTVQLKAAGFNYPGAAGVDPATLLTFNSKVKAVPEPFTMLGSAAALGFGALMKRKSSQLKSKKGGSTLVPSTCENLA